MKIKSILITVALVVICNVSFAQETSEKKDKKTQKERIEQGVKSGELTKSERAKIAEERKETREAVKEAKADGVITDAEKANIKKERKEASKTIYKKKHNDKKSKK